MIIRIKLRCFESNEIESNIFISEILTKIFIEFVYFLSNKVKIKMVCFIILFLLIKIAHSQTTADCPSPTFQIYTGG